MTRPAARSSFAGSVDEVAIVNGYEKHSPDYGGPGKWRWGRVAVVAGWVAAFIAIIVLRWGK